MWSSYQCINLVRLYLVSYTNYFYYCLIYSGFMPARTSWYLMAVDNHRFVLDLLSRTRGGSKAVDLGAWHPHQSRVVTGDSMLSLRRRYYDVRPRVIVSCLWLEHRISSRFYFIHVVFWVCFWSCTAVTGLLSLTFGNCLYIFIAILLWNSFHLDGICPAK